MRRKKLWKPTLFSVLGAGFKNDDTVNDGIHLRWNFDTRLGLPFRKDNTHKGTFKVYVMNLPEKSIKNVDLFKANKKSYRINSADLFHLNIATAQHSILPFANRLYFIKKTKHDHVALDWHYKNISKYIKLVSAVHSNTDTQFSTYMDTVMTGFRPFYVPTKSDWEIDEVCAVDIQFTRNTDNDTVNPNRGTHRTSRRGRKKFTLQQFHKMNAKNATKIAGDLTKFANITNHSILKNAVNNFKITDFKKPNTRFKAATLNRPIVTANLNPNALRDFNATVRDGVVLTHFKNDVYVRVKAWNRDDQVVDEDWIGKHGINRFAIRGPFGNPTPNHSGKLKTKIKLRAAGIAYLTFEFVPNKPVLYPKHFNYVFCEDYCGNDKIWSTHRNFETHFNGNPNAYTASHVKNDAFAPFKKGFDWNSLASNLRQHFIEDPHVNALLAQQNTYDTYSYRAHYDAPDAELDTEDAIDLPLLPSLTSASIDPAFANILGLYMFIDQLQHDGKDFKVEADFPFFDSKNIDVMDVKLAKLINSTATDGILDGLKFTLHDILLCGLVLGPRISKKAVPPITAPLQSEAKAIDLPNQNNPNVYDLFGDAQIKIPFKANEIRPYQKIIAVALDKSLNGNVFENIIASEDENTTVLDGFGILPGVYIPRLKDGVVLNPMEVDDYFSLPAVADNTLQYQARGFDLFGRPSQVAQGVLHHLALPCKAPQKPANISSQLVTQGDALILEVLFSLYDGILPLTATKLSAEITIHELPIDTTPAAELSWAGQKTAKVFAITYNAAGTHLNTAALTQHCNQLSWTGDTLNRASANTALCNAAFSNNAPVLSEIDAPAFSLATTGFRTYKLSWNIATKSALPPKTHQWASRIRVKGFCETSGKTLYSQEPVVTASITITPPPPPVQQPLLNNIPESTFPDAKGDAYFTLDFNDFIPPGDRASKPMVRVYMVTLDKLFEDNSTVVDHNVLLEEALFITRAKTSKLPYKLITTNPIRYSANTRFLDLKVPGDLEAYHVVGVIGCNAYLEEVSWLESGVLLFKTPAPVKIPQLQFVVADPFTIADDAKIALEFSTKFTSNLPDIAQAPRIQIFKRNATLNSPNATFIDTIEGVLDPNSASGTATYSFDYLDEAILALNRYEYEAYLLVFSEKHGHYIKADRPTTCTTIGPVNEQLSFSDAIETPNVVFAPDKTTISFEFDAGEYEFSLTKKLNDGSTQRHTGKIRHGVLLFDAFKAQLVVNARYNLIFEDPDTAIGIYTLRVSYGQLFTWTKKTEATP